MTKCYADDLDEVAAALAHRGRRQVVSRLCEGPASTTDLAGGVGVSLSTMHQHLRVLADARLVASHKSGRVVTHRLRPEPLARYETWLTARTSFWAQQLDALTDHLAGSGDQP